jgi:DNA-binding transcriptional MerR regulator
MKEPDFENYKINVDKIISSTFNALMYAYSLHPEWYESIEVTSTTDGLFTSRTVTFKKDSPLKSIIQAAQGAGGLISELAQGANDIMNMYIKDSDGKRIPIDLKDLKVGGKLHKAVEGIVTGVMQALIYAYDNTCSGATDKIKWSKNVLRDHIMPVLENLQKMAEIIPKFYEVYSKNKKMFWEAEWFIKYDCKDLMNALTYAHDKSGSEKSMKWTSNIIKNVLPEAIENACAIQETIKNHTITSSDNTIGNNMISLMDNVTLIINSLGSVYTNTPAGITKKMQWTKNILLDEVIPSIANIKAVQRSLNNFTIDDNTTKLANFETLVLGLFTPFVEVKPKEIKKFSTTFSNKNVNNITTLVKTVNTLNTNKADKFIQMIAELRQLSLSIKDMPKFIALLDQKLTESLSVLSDRIDSASTVLQDSDKMQQERQSKIEDNAKLLREMLQTPIKLELFKEDTGSGEASEDFGFDGDMESGGSVDTGGSMDTGGSSNLTGLVQKIARKLGAI